MKLLFPLALLVLIMVPLQCASGLDSESVQCREEERLALLHINASIHFHIHSLDGKWEGKECCQWERVTCDPITGHVTQLDLGIPVDDDDWFNINHGGILLNTSMFLPLRQLRSLSLSGHGIHNCTDGAGLETWSNLTKLEILDLSYNSLDGSIIYDLAAVLSLRTLDLSHNIIDSSSLPINGFESWSNLTKLQMLDLSDNYLPKSIISSSAKVSSLRALYLDDISMGGNINVPVNELINAVNLEVLSLRNCQLSGSFLDLGRWSSLKALSLAYNDLNDTLSLEGLCRLKNLEELDLSGNNFIGNLPPCLGNLSSLELLDLSINQFQIKFPSIFDRLVSLRYLSLSNNQFEGTLFMRSFRNHSNLEVMSLSTLESSSFRVEVENLPFQLQVLELANCILDVEPNFLYSQHKLHVLDLSNTRSMGPAPAVWLLENNTDMIKLYLYKNNFIGPLQLPFLSHEKLSLLDISDNHLNEELPADITTKLPSLMFLALSKNYFHGPLPPLSTSNLRILDLSSNSLIDDVHNSFSRIQPSIPYFMDLSNNKFYGSFTFSMNFTPHSILLLNNNNISGNIPFNICNTSFKGLDISNNELNGVLPDCIGKVDFEALKLSGNHLEGSLPLEMCAVEELDLSHNKFSGSIPPCSNQSYLLIVDLSYNNLIGNFPLTWLNSSYIYAIDIAENYLSGELPIDMESKLSMLLARENMFRGPIPKQICQFKYLRILDLSHNNLSGEIPSCILDVGSTAGEFPTLGGFELDSLGLGKLKSSDTDTTFLLNSTNHVYTDFKKILNFGLELMSKGRLDFYLEEILHIQCIIDLSSNKLIGNIPEGIGRMIWLITLNLSSNHLSGTIPNSISNLHQLESLDLSHNSLTGEIPRELTKLTSLESFSVAYNDLSGPTLRAEAQFGTFDDSSYEGNMNLCGPPLSESCDPTLGTTQPFSNKMGDDRRYEGIDFLILFGSFSLFFVVSFWCFMAVLYFKRNWRYAFFILVDQYGDMIYVKVVLSTRKIRAALTLMG